MMWLTTKLNRRAAYTRCRSLSSQDFLAFLLLLLEGVGVWDDDGGVAFELAVGVSTCWRTGIGPAGL